MITGSFTNHCLANTRMPEPTEGMGVTELCYTDRHAYTIVCVSRDKKRIWIARDTATRTDTNGMSEVQSYDFIHGSTIPGAPQTCVTLRKNGRWVRQGDSMNGTKYLVGEREEYRDYSF